MALTKARTLGVKGLMIPSAGNAGGAAAVYGARGGIPVVVVVPRGTAGGRHRRGDHRGRPRLHGGRLDRDGGQADRGHRVQDRLVRSGHAEGALSSRGQEDDGARAGRAARLAGAGSPHVPDGRRHRPRRDLEGVRGAGGHGLDQGRPAPLRRRPGRRVRAARQGVGREGRDDDALGESRHGRARSSRAWALRGAPDAQDHARHGWACARRERAGDRGGAEAPGARRGHLDRRPRPPPRSPRSAR